MANEATPSITAGFSGEKLGAKSLKVSGVAIMSNPAIGRIVFCGGCFLVAVAVWWTERHVEAVPQVYGELVTDLGSSQQSQLSAFLEMNRLIITLSTTTLGAMGFFLSHGRKGNFLARELWAASACALCVGLSLFYGYHAYQDIIFMLQNNTFDLSTALITWDHHLHFATFVLGTFFFVDFAFNELNKKEAPANDPSNL